MNGITRTFVLAALLVATWPWASGPAIAQDVGQINIVQFVCASEGKHTIEVISATVAADPPPPANCEPGESYFSDYLYLVSPPESAGVASQPAASPSEGAENVVVIPVSPGEHILGDPFDPSVSLTFTVAAGETVTIRSIVYSGATDGPTGELQIVKVLCDAEGAAVIREVESPEEAVEVPENCDLGESAFGVRNVAKAEPPTTFSTESDSGIAIADLQPGTYEVTDMSDPMMTSVLVEIAAGETASLQSIEYAVDRAPELCGEGLGAPEPGGTEPVVANGPMVRWSIPIESVFISNLFAVNELSIFLQADSMQSSAIMVLGADSGQTVWCKDLGGMHFGAPWITDGVILEVLEPGLAEPPGIVGYNAANGEELWRTSLDEDSLAAAFEFSRAGEGIVVGPVFSGRTMELMAIDVHSGEERWRFTPERQESFFGANLVAGGMVFVSNGSTEGTGLLALDASTGEQRWFAEHPEWGAVPSLSYSDGVVFLNASQSPTCCIVALDAETGALLWQSEGDPNPYSAPLVPDGVVYTSRTPGFAAIDAVSGSDIWFSDLGYGQFPMQGSAAMLGDQVVVADAFGHDGQGANLIGLDAATGAELWRLPLGPPDMPVAPVSAGEAVIVTGTEILALEQT